MHGQERCLRALEFFVMVLHPLILVVTSGFCHVVRVSVGQTEAKIEAIMNDFIQLEPQSNLFEAETMVEGTLDGFLFDSDEEGEKVTEANPKEKNNGNGDQPSYMHLRRPNEKMTSHQYFSFYSQTG
ncbi:DNA-binding protein BIN4 [Carex littledalei]|uniref:DNA-binding protein BIN4 n=1 Tax=Carex littledalei TaxID=544730 RepID=A0A833VIF0_9POAL|nr:DNA-binding protein BIN4 [Carex littledalei]